MRTFLAALTILSAVVPAVADIGAAVTARSRQVFLAEAESSGPTRFGRDTAQVAEASLPSPGGHDTAI